MAATSSYKTFLMKGTGTTTVTYTKLCDIVEFPDLGGAPELLDATTLSDKMRVYIAGIQDLEGLTFTANYEKDVYSTLSALAGTDTAYAVWFGGTETNGVVTPTGSDGKFSFRGDLTCWVSGAGVNEVRQMQIQIANSTVITFE